MRNQKKTERSLK